MIVQVYFILVVSKFLKIEIMLTLFGYKYDALSLTYLFGLSSLEGRF